MAPRWFVLRQVVNNAASAISSTCRSVGMVLNVRQIGWTDHIWWLFDYNTIYSLNDCSWQVTSFWFLQDVVFMNFADGCLMIVKLICWLWSILVFFFLHIFCRWLARFNFLFWMQMVAWLSRWIPFLADSMLLLASINPMRNTKTQIPSKASDLFVDLWSMKRPRKMVKFFGAKSLFLSFGLVSLNYKKSFC